MISEGVHMRGRSRKAGAVFLLAIVLSLGFNVTYGARNTASLKPEEAYWAEELRRDPPPVKVNETVMAMVEERDT
ncbi:hypothetical protein [Thermococcus sp.]|uniref:hypothetical protein n=1 Tax=Thermococcus sp. TaxID=35749 RepID=UPI0026128007|nr:hypothetical protein [Thermococcus sp.]